MRSTTAARVYFSLATGFLMLLAIVLLGWAAWEIVDALLHGEVLGVLDSAGLVIIGFAIIETSRFIAEEELVRQQGAALGGRGAALADQVHHHHRHRRLARGAGDDLRDQPHRRRAGDLSGGAVRGGDVRADRARRSSSGCRAASPPAPDADRGEARSSNRMPKPSSDRRPRQGRENHGIPQARQQRRRRLGLLPRHDDLRRRGRRGDLARDPRRLRRGRRQLHRHRRRLHRPAPRRRSSAAGWRRTRPRRRQMVVATKAPLPDGRRARTTSAPRAGTWRRARRLAAPARGRADRPLPDARLGRADPDRGDAALPRRRDHAPARSPTTASRTSSAGRSPRRCTSRRRTASRRR